MKKFQQFQLHKSELIFGGDLVMTTCTGVVGRTGDIIDTDTGQVFF